MPSLHLDIPSIDWAPRPSTGGRQDGGKPGRADPTPVSAVRPDSPRPVTGPVRPEVGPEDFAGVPA